MAYVGLNFGVEGGGSPTGATAKNLQNQLTNIINHVNNSLPKIQITWDTKGINTFQNRLEQLTNVARREANNIQSAYQNIQFPNIPPDPSGGNDNGKNPFSKIIRKNNLLARTATLMRSITESTKKFGASSAPGSGTEGAFSDMLLGISRLAKLSDDLENDVVALAKAEKILSEINAKYKQAMSAITQEDMDFNVDDRNKKILEAQKEIKSMRDNLKKWNSASDPNNKGYSQYKEYERHIDKLEQALKALQSGGAIDEFNAELAKIKTAAYSTFSELDRLGATRSKEKGFQSYIKDLKTVSTLLDQAEQSARNWSLAKIADHTTFGELEALIAELKKLKREMVDTGKVAPDFSENIARIEAGISKVGGRLNLDNRDSQTFGDWVFSKVGEVSKYIDVMDFIYKAVEYGKKMVDAVTEIDTAMTELRKVTDETNVSYNAFLEEASRRAQNLGTSVSNVVSASADFARLGYDLDEASSLADAAIVYKNVGDGINDIDTASSSIISTMQAFNIEASDAMSIVDSFNNVGNNFAISSAGIGEALLNSAAALSAANNDLHESIALIAAAICIGSLCSNA